MHMPKPRLGPFEINFNTVVVVICFVFTWAYTYAELEAGRTTNASNITRLETRVERLEVNSRLLDNHELRLGAVERQATDAATALRAVEQSISSLASDTRLMREILERLERAQSGQRAPQR